MRFRFWDLGWGLRVAESKYKGFRFGVWGFSFHVFEFKFRFHGPKGVF